MENQRNRNNRDQVVHTSNNYRKTPSVDFKRSDNGYSNGSSYKSKDHSNSAYKKDTTNSIKTPNLNIPQNSSNGINGSSIHLQDSTKSNANEMILPPLPEKPKSKIYSPSGKSVKIIRKENYQDSQTKSGNEFKSSLTIISQQGSTQTYTSQSSQNTKSSSIEDLKRRIIKITSSNNKRVENNKSQRDIHSTYESKDNLSQSNLKEEEVPIIKDIVVPIVKDNQVIAGPTKPSNNQERNSQSSQQQQQKQISKAEERKNKKRNEDNTKVMPQNDNQVKNKATVITQGDKKKNNANKNKRSRSRSLDKRNKTQNGQSNQRESKLDNISHKDQKNTERVTKSGSNLNSEKFQLAKARELIKLKGKIEVDQEVKIITGEPKQKEDALKEKEILRKASKKGAKIDVRLFVGQVPKTWDDSKVMSYFKRMGSILEAKIIRDKNDNSHKGCAFLRCVNFHEAEFILKVHKVSKKHSNKSKDQQASRTRQRSRSNRRNNRNNRKSKSPIDKTIKRENSQRSARSSSSYSDDSSSSDDDSSYFDEKSNKIMNKLQVRYADGELERLGIVNLEKTEQSKLYICHISKDRQTHEINKLFAIFGDIEELYMFRDSDESFKGSCFIKFSMRKQAIKSILKLNQKSQQDPYLKSFPGFIEENQVLEVRFADKKRKDNIPLSLIPPSLLGFNSQDPNSIMGKLDILSQQQMLNMMMIMPQNMNASLNSHTMNQPTSSSNSSGNNKNSKSTASFAGISQIPTNQLASHQSMLHPTVTSSLPNQLINPIEYQQKMINMMSGHSPIDAMQFGMNFFQMIPTKPGKRTFLECISIDGKTYYFDMQRNLSQWEKPKNTSQQDQDVVIMSTKEVQELYQNYLALQFSYGMPLTTGLNPVLGQKMFGMPLGMSTSPFMDATLKQTDQAMNSCNDIFGQQLSQNDNSIGAINGNNNVDQLDPSNTNNAVGQGQYKQGPAGANLFIFHLPNEWTDVDLYVFFDAFKLGNIVSVRIMTDKETGRSKGFGKIQSMLTNNRFLINGKQALGKRLKVELKKGGMHLPPQGLNATQFQQMQGNKQMVKTEQPTNQQQICSNSGENNDKYSSKNLNNMIYEAINVQGMDNAFYQS
ncbi:rna binding protein [Stylonychia lemnae]|uniref:Rna binding protein n=1 Tax=Stylonychia lemnae TaxID=5949 RepID=A0A078B4W4_STYLE|nr:rna binding protein [Stylonychia lemnae]|eukprot:CDW88267.1 rna binding protein [Stylonychia lemnae]